MTHRVEFADTDMAGIIHFSSYFRYMEVTEHAFFRSLGLSITGTEGIGWPRVHVECDFKLPLRFEDEVEVELTIAELRSKLISYSYECWKIASERLLVATGKITTVAVSPDVNGDMKATVIPDQVVQLLKPLVTH